MKKFLFLMLAAVLLLAVGVFIYKTPTQPGNSGQKMPVENTAASTAAAEAPAASTSPAVQRTAVSKPVAPAAPVEISSASRFQPIDESLVVDQRVTDVSNGWKKRELLVKAGGKYPFRRVEETLEQNNDGTWSISARIEMVADHVLVKLQDGQTKDDLLALLNRYGVSILRELALPGHYIVSLKVAALDAVPDAMATFSTESNVLAYAEPDYISRVNAVPNDTNWSSLWGMRKINATGAWDVATGSTNVIVAVIDTGISLTHPDLVSNLWKNVSEKNGVAGVDDDGNGYADDINGWDFGWNDNNPDDNGDVDHGGVSTAGSHGTHCAGTIGAVGNNALGVAGVCWSVRIMPVKAASYDETYGMMLFADSDLADAVHYAADNGAKVISASYGGYSYSATEHDAIEYANGRGVLFIAAAGNESSNNDTAPAYPASYDIPNIISVAATDSGDLLADFSNYGQTSVDIAAPGVGILSTVPGGTYESFQGTSMATPHVAGAAALLLSKNPSLTNLQLKEAVLNSVDKISALSSKVASGGRLNVARMIALQDTDHDGIPDDWETSHGLNPNNPNDALLDPDHDHLNNLGEYENHCVMTNADTDADTLVDGWEVTYGFNPNSPTGGLAEVSGLGGFSVSGNSKNVVVDGNYAYVAAGSGGLVVLNVSDPTRPVFAGSYTARTANDVAVTNGYAYVASGGNADGTNGLVVINVSNPSSLWLKGQCNTAGSADGVAIRGNYAYLADGVNQLLAIDISNPAQPRQVGKNVLIPLQQMKDVFIQGDVAYVASIANVYRMSLSNPTSPVANAASQNLTGQPIKSVHGSSSVIAAASGVNGVHVLSTSLAPPTPVFDTIGDASGVYVSGNYVYVADGLNGLVVLDVSAPSSPTQVVHIATTGAATGVFVYNGYTYVTEGALGLEIFSILPDSDGDGLLNSWEMAYFGSLDRDGTGDFDGDGISDWGEYLAGLNPTNADQDADGLVDGTQEVVIYNTDPRNPDTDGDGLTDGAEVVTHHTNPVLADTDGDGMNDGWEITYGFDPLDALNPGASGDADGDGLTNLEESQSGTNPNNPDTDSDGMDDGWEVGNNLNPLVDDAALDPDGDGLTNLQEYGLGTNPHLSDTDSDGMPDGWEHDNGLNPLVKDASDDADSDGLKNLGEYQAGTDPNDSDSDDDGMPDGWEVTNFLNPLMNDASEDPDFDKLLNIQEYCLASDTLWAAVYTSVTGSVSSFSFGMPGSTDPHKADSDGDGLTDFYEITINAATTNLFITNPNDADTDNDGFSDGWEVANGFDPLIVEDPSTTDRDHDGLTDAEELALGTQPNNFYDPIFVDDDGPNDRWPGNPDGFGPAVENGTISNAYDSIQQAVNVASNGMTVLLNEGEYYGTGNFNIDTKGKDITIRAWNTNDPSVTVVNSLGYGTVFSMHSGETTNTVLRGLGITVTLSECSDGDCDSEHAIALSGASPKIMDCLIYDAQLDGIHCESNSSPLILNCTVANVLNGIWCEGASSPRIEDCLIANVGHASAGDVGIGIYADSSSGMYIGGTIVSDCNGRGIAMKDSVDAVIETSTISDSRGGILCDNSSPRIERCIIRDNDAPNYFTVNDIPVVSSSIFPLGAEGYVDTTDEDENGGGILMLRGSSPFIINCLVVGNRTWADDPELHYSGLEVIQDYGLGGAFYIGSGCSPTGANCTVANNHANTRGGGLSSFQSPYLRNMIFWGNTCSNAIIDKDIRTVSTNSVYRNLHCRSGSINITYSDIQYGYPTAKNSTTNNPLFVGGGDYQLVGTNSPCYNKAGPDLAPTNDLVGFIRPTEDDWPDRVDIGCYEFADNDGDGMNNDWERLNGLDPENAADASLDPDSDGLTNLQEYQHGTDPNNPDSDYDGLNDGDEISAGTLPNNPDTDGDDLADGDEISAGTNPVKADTDNDGMPDGWEVFYGLNPLVNDAAADLDSDLLTNLFEYQTGTNPNSSDTDGDGLPDKWEINNTLNPKSSFGNDGASGDPDNDGLTNIQEFNRGTNPRNADTDGDGMTDGQEVTNGTDPLDPDTDGDGMPNGWEVDNGLDPTVHDGAADKDDDGLTNLKEYQAGTDPNDEDTDKDGIKDGWEVLHDLNPLMNDAASDPDSDGLTNLEEYDLGTNPQSPDTDSDGMPDGWEQNYGLNPLASNGAADADSDGLSNFAEYVAGTSPNNPDSDGDGMPDGWEVTYGLNPLLNDAAGDLDGDHATNLKEYRNGTNPAVPDSQYLDDDGDGMPNGWETGNGLNPNSAVGVDGASGDPDGDGLSNLQEYLLETDPQDSDTDNDGLTDGAEVNTFSTSPLNSRDPIFVDDDAATDPEPGNPNVSSTNENGSITYPFDSIQEAINSANLTAGMTVLVTNGLYEGTGNFEVNPAGKEITIRSWNGSAGTIIRTHAYGSAFVFNSGETTNTVVGGFTIETLGDLAPEEGIVVDGSSPLITNCVIRNCELEAVSCLNEASPQILNCRFYDVLNGLYANGSKGVLLRQSVVSNTTGRGIVIVGDDSAEVTWSTIENCVGGITLDDSDASIRQCFVQNNVATNEAGAGIQILNSSSPLIRNALIIGNSATDTNSAGVGGGLYIGEGCSPTGVNCTVSGNSAGISGGGISSSGRPLFRNMIIWGNTAISNQNLEVLDGVINIWYSDIEGGYSNAVLSIDADPLFNGDYTLQAASPCIDSGTYYLAPLVDLSGDLRPTAWPDRVDMGCYEDGASAAANPIALGAKIAQSEPLVNAAADTDGDGYTDGQEIALGTDMYNGSDYFQVVHEQNLVDGAVRITWKSMTGCRYTVQSTDSLTGSWINEPFYTDLPGVGGTMTFSADLPAGGVRYYRVQVYQP